MNSTVLMKFYEETTLSLRQYSTLMFNTRITSVGQSIILLGGAGILAKDGEYLFSLCASCFSTLIGAYLYFLHKNYANHYNGFLALAIEYEQSMELGCTIAPWSNYKKIGKSTRESTINKLIHHQVPFHLTVISSLVIAGFNIYNLTCNS